MTMSEQLPGPARELRDGDPGAGGAAEGGRQDAARRRVRPRRLAGGAAAGRVLGAGSRASRRPPKTAWRRRRRGGWTRTAATATRRRGPRRQGRGAVRGRRVRDRDPVGEGLGGPRDLAAPGEVQHPAGRGGGAGAVRRATSRSSSSPRSTSRRSSATRRARVQLSPLRFHFDAERAAPAGAARAAERERQAGPDRLRPPPDARFEVANYANVFIPTNLEVAGRGAQHFGAFYAELFDATRREDGPQGGGHRVRVADDRLRSCPTPPLSPTIWRRWASTCSRASASAVRRAPANKRRRRAPMAPPTFFGGAPSWVLTRLHARYSKETLSEDLVFREAKPAMGGRANWNGTNGDEGAQVDRRAASTTSRAATSSATTGTGRSPARTRATTAGAARPATRRRAGADGREGAGDRAARKVVLKAEVRSPVPLLGHRRASRRPRPERRRT